MNNLTTILPTAVSSANTASPAVASLFDVLKKVKPETVINMSKIMGAGQSSPFAAQYFSEGANTLKTALENGYDPGLLAEDMDFYGGFPYSYSNSNTVEFPSDLCGDDIVDGIPIPHDSYAKIFPAQASAQAFLPNKSNKSWRRPPGDFSIDTFYEDNFGQTPYRRY